MMVRAVDMADAYKASGTGVQHADFPEFAHHPSAAGTLRLLER